MNSREALNCISQKLADGVPKHVIFQELLPKITFKGDLLAYIAQIPDLEARQKYRSLNYFLLSTLIFLFILHSIIIFLTIPNIRLEHTPWLVMFGFGFFLIPMFLLFIIWLVARFRSPEGAWRQMAPRRFELRCDPSFLKAGYSTRRALTSLPAPAAKNDPW